MNRNRQPASLRSSIRTAERGFTLTELLAIITMVWIFTMLAVPSMRTFSNRNYDLASATRLSQTVNRVKAQARRRNRAYVIDFRLFLQGEPAGRVHIRESDSSSCQSTAEQAVGGLTLIKDLPFGQTESETYSGAKESDVGLRGWMLAGDAERRDQLRLCISPDGATSILNGQAVEPLSGRLRIFVQAYERSPGQWRAFGPARRVEMTFAGPARLAVD